MWFQKRKRGLSFSSNEEFYGYVDSLSERLKKLNLFKPAQEIHAILHETAWTTSSEPLGEIKFVLLRLKAQHGSELPRDLDDEISFCIKFIENIWSRANR